MLLKMLIAGEVIDAVPIEAHRLHQVLYLEAMLQCLRQKHGERLEQASTEAEFYLEVGSKMNITGFESIAEPE
ncbi:hypothetical protein HRG84_19700 [Flavisolibacter sp. BT320]|nr:hypothetical protein [Flavisolibacter longurius]